MNHEKDCGHTTSEPTLIVEQVGAQALVQDVGRPGFLHLGVPPSGALDRPALRRGNALVGNADDAAGIEILLAGLAIRATVRAVVAVTGAPAEVRLDGRPAAFGAPLDLGPGEVLQIGPALSGLRTYLTARGGIVESAQVPSAFGSLSSDLTSALGPAALAAGSALRLGARRNGDPLWQHVSPASSPVSTVTASWGPRSDWLDAASQELLGSAEWRVSGDLDRVGMRLEGPTLQTRGGELPSEGLVRGAVQLPPSGQPVVFLADHPTTGGYPVVAVVDDAQTDALAQLRPGDSLRFRLRRLPWDRR